VYSAYIKRKGKGRGKGKDKGKGKYAYSTEHGKGKGNCKGKGKSLGNICGAKDCGSDSGRFKFCLECIKRGMEERHVICTDGYKQVIERRNKSKTENKQIEGLSALGQHMATHIRSEM
jgi:hypothetical protein